MEPDESNEYVEPGYGFPEPDPDAIAANEEIASAAEDSVAEDEDTGEYASTGPEDFDADIDAADLADGSGGNPGEVGGNLDAEDEQEGSPASVAGSRGPGDVYYARRALLRTLFTSEETNEIEEFLRSKGRLYEREA